jgi:hypothetical protein
MWRGCTMVSACVLCLSGAETTTHLFLTCSFATWLWKWLGDLFQHHFDCTTILTVFQSCKHSWSVHIQHLALAAISHAALCAFANHDVVPWDLRNRWKNCMLLALNLIRSHIFREGNSCADRLANHGHLIIDFTWWNFVPQFLTGA